MPPKVVSSRRCNVLFHFFPFTGATRLHLLCYLQGPCLIQTIVSGGCANLLKLRIGVAPRMLAAMLVCEENVISLSAADLVFLMTSVPTSPTPLHWQKTKQKTNN